MPGYDVEQDRFRRGGEGHEGGAGGVEEGEGGS